MQSIPHQTPTAAHSSTTRTHKIFFSPTTNLHIPYWSPDHKKYSFGPWEYFFWNYFETPIAHQTYILMQEKSNTPSEAANTAHTLPLGMDGGIPALVWSTWSKICPPCTDLCHPNRHQTHFLTYQKSKTPPEATNTAYTLPLDTYDGITALVWPSWSKICPPHTDLCHPNPTSNLHFDAPKIQNAFRATKSTLEGCSWPIGTRTWRIWLGRPAGWLCSGLKWRWMEFLDRHGSENFLMRLMNQPLHAVLDAYFVLIGPNGARMIPWRTCQGPQLSWLQVANAFGSHLMFMFNSDGSGWWGSWKMSNPVGCLPKLLL